DVRDERGLAGPPPRTLLYLLLRHAVLATHATVALRIRLAAGAAQPSEAGDPAVVDVLDAPSATLGRHAEGELPGLPGRRVHELTAHDHPGAAPLDELRESLARFRELPERALDELLAETLDLFGHRLDAWVTSLATRRLERMREARPRGLLIGGF